MKKHLLILAMAVVALCTTVVSCQKDDIVDDTNTTDTTGSGDNSSTDSQFVGVYDMDMVYDSITTSDGTWFSEEFFEQMTGKVNSPEHGYLTIAAGQNGKLNMTVTFNKTDGDKVFFTTTATEKDGALIIDDCNSDYYYASIEDMIHFAFHGFAATASGIYFKSIYTVNLGADYSYLTAYTCTKRS